MSIDTFAQRMLTELSGGKEINWDYMPRMVHTGMIRREAAVNSLKSCLERVIPNYEKMQTMAGATYWRERVIEAGTALTSIKTSQPVKYRGIQL